MKWILSAGANQADVRLTERAHDASVAEGVALWDLDVEFDRLAVPAPLTLCCTFACTDIYAVWSPSVGPERRLGVDWHMRTTASRLSSGAPLHVLLSSTGHNRLTVALSDALTPTEIRTGVIEETAEIKLEIRFFTQPQSPLGHYHAIVYLDTAPRRYEDAIRLAEHFWAEQCGYPGALVPPTARLPMYSTWYSFHQNTVASAILQECRLAKEMGMDCVIVDDGWQTDDGSRGYAYCGDWAVTPAKIPDMRAFVEDVHAIGMKIMLWYSVPFVGEFSRAFSRFDGLFLCVKPQSDGARVGTLDPRYPAVRQYLVSLYADALVRYDLDGFKLDFIDSFRLYPETPATDARRDIDSLETAVMMLLEEITATLKKIKPDILLEFRQSYIGPAIRKYGNMMRVGDCPLESLVNRRASVDLRLCCGGSAVHSDMIMWHARDDVRSAALQIISTLFAVPQISVRLETLPAAHRRMLGFYLRFFRENRDVLLDGTLYADGPECAYTLVRAEKDGRLVAVNYTGVPFTVDGTLSLAYLVNAGPDDTLVVELPPDGGERVVTVYDCTGELCGSAARHYAPGLYKIDVPRAGMVKMEKG